ncbi:hypothetical protein RMR21_009645 [Agrobacterium sp. rho-8.1]|nr:hypothetical protein [Agrobacterium sp. rho-8.1]
MTILNRIDSVYEIRALENPIVEIPFKHAFGIVGEDYIPFTVVFNETEDKLEAPRRFCPYDERLKYGAWPYEFGVYYQYVLMKPTDEELAFIDSKPRTKIILTAEDLEQGA